MILKLITAPTQEPLSIPEVKDHLRVTQDYEDALFRDMIGDAREYCERNVRGYIQAMTATWDLILPCLPQVIELPYPPLQSITSVTYYDTANDSQTLASDQYIVLAPTRHKGCIVPAVDVSWPSTVTRPDAVTVRFVAGFASQSAVPRSFKRAMKMLISYWDKNRDAAGIGAVSKEVAFSVSALLNNCEYGAL